MSSFPPSAATDPSLPHGSKVTYIIGICSAMMVLVTVVVIARFWIRFKLVKGQLGADDWCILFAWLLAIAFDLDPINQTRFGLGQYTYDLRPDTNFTTSLKLYYVGEILFYICVAVTKIAILNLYLRIAVQKIYRRLIWACMAFVILTAGACVMASIFQCTPIHKAWDAAGTVHGSCFNINALPIANSALDIVQDTLIYVLPMRMLYQIQMATRQKIALMGVFAVGGFVVITGMIRLNSLRVTYDTLETSYQNYRGAVWSSIESNIGVVCACLPTFKALIDRFFPSLMGYQRKPSRNTPPEGSAPGKRGYMRNPDQIEFELEHGTGWKDSDTSNYGGENNNSYSATAEAKPTFQENSSKEHLRGVEANKIKNGGIWKSTSLVVSHG